MCRAAILCKSYGGSLANSHEAKGAEDFNIHIALFLLRRREIASKWNWAFLKEQQVHLPTS
jgi:hypothetical protein